MRLHPIMMEMATNQGDMHYLILLIYQMVHERAQRSDGVYMAAEMGVRSGSSTVAILAGMEQAKNGHLLSCDIDPCEWTINCVKVAELDKRWEFVVSDSVELGRRQADDAFDLIFVDTSHEKEHTEKEIAVWTRKLKPGGRIMFHDTLDCPVGVGGPVMDFVRLNPAWKYYNIDVCCGLGMLDKPK